MQPDIQTTHPHPYSLPHNPYALLPMGTMDPPIIGAGCSKACNRSRRGGTATNVRLVPQTPPVAGPQSGTAPASAKNSWVNIDTNYRCFFNNNNNNYIYLWRDRKKKKIFHFVKDAATSCLHNNDVRSFSTITDYWLIHPFPSINSEKIIDHHRMRPFVLVCPNPDVLFSA